MKRVLFAVVAGCLALTLSGCEHCLCTYFQKPTPVVYTKSAPTQDNHK